LPRAQAVIELTPAEGHVKARLHLEDLRDLGPAAARCRRLLHLDADPAGISDVLDRDELLGPLVRKRPGLRVPGSVDPFETAIRAIVGQQVSIAAARTVAGRIVAAYGTPLAKPMGTLTHTFPTPEALAEATELPMPRSRTRTITGLAAAIANGDVRLDRGVDWSEVRESLLDLPGIGPWTVEYIALRGLGDPDAFPGTDLGIRHSLVALGIADDPATITALATRWKPLRSYAAQHLWTYDPERKAT
jgi:AraC family transcriptional regulator of adaptative response / DNA-3-methyladenine glycosylase II